MHMRSKPKPEVIDIEINLKNKIKTFKMECLI